MKSQIFKKVMLLSLCVIFTSGCGVYRGVKNRDGMNKVRLGMTPNEVQNLMAFSPKRRESYKLPTGDTAEILFYQINTFDKFLTPFYFKNNVLIGWGKDYTVNGEERHQAKDYSSRIQEAGQNNLKVRAIGLSDNQFNGKQADRKEAILDAKRQAIEKAGVRIESETLVRMGIVYEDFIESKAKTTILPGYEIVDIGYDADNKTYQVVLIGEVLVNTD